MSTINRSEPAPTPEEVWRLFRETCRRFQELEYLMKESARESDRRLQELERFIKESRQEIERMSQ